ncbi:hypothetical protein SAMN04487818_101356 [Actinokineospora terrae]|uniref:Uncharacterized protein n=1 Tax=Actinokineospora terrae TaxID=155974 RepID=A0A1H9KWQ5_9PSEU|nr:hypothetical protein SAMN04487818_101356 [Actinokineospora terrae]
MKCLITAMPVLPHPRALGAPVTARIAPDRHRFDSPLDLADSSTAFGRVAARHRVARAQEGKCSAR